ncbi:MAG TPA: glycosyltransferase family 2 protein [Firmicutes bacterium]|nr:glycosyltransferase family 2 protein [Candidatus Fermentithermobacillaceae bacterium]
MITLVIPFYNEEAVLERTVEEAESYLKSIFGDFELILVDDGSTDSSLEIAREHEKAGVRVLTYAPNRGKGYAVRMGMLSARGDVVFFCDADLSYGLEVLKPAYDKIASGSCDVLVGSRNMEPDAYKSYPILRKVASRVFVMGVNAVLRLGVSDSQCGFKGFTRDAAQQVFGCAKVNGFAFDIEALYLARQMGLRIEEMPVRLLVHSGSKVNVLWDSLRMMRDVFKVRFSSLPAARKKGDYGK